MANHWDETKVHRAHNWEYADAAARVAATGMVAGDVGKLALQLDNSSLWVLTDDSPVTWASPSAAALAALGLDALTIHGADVASASTVDLDAATGDLVDVTGTAAITAITLTEGRWRTVRFTGILTLTYGSSLVLPTGASITTAAGDFAIFRGYAAGVVRCVTYSRASGAPLAGGGGDVVGPSSSVNARIAAFSGTTGKLLADSGVSVADLAALYEALDSDLGVIAGLTATTDNFIQSKSSAWASRTVAQVSADLQGTGLISDAVGFRTVPQNSQSTAYTAVAADAGKHILHPSADTTARVFTIPANSSVAYPIGTAITFVNQNSGGVITISITTDTMRLAGAGTTGSRTLAANGIATALKITSTEWIISGTGLT